MDITTVLTGLLPAVIITASVFTLVASAILLWLYRRATMQGMIQRAMPEKAPSPTQHTRAVSVTEAQLTITVLKDDSDNTTTYTYTPTAHSRFNHASQSSRTIAITYCLGGLAYAIIMSITWMYLAGGFSAGRLVWLLTVYLWPTVIVLNLLIAVSKKEIVLIAAAYTLIVLLAGSLVLIRNDESTIGQLLFFWLFSNLAASGLFVAFLQQRIRSVGPLVYAIMIAGVTGALVLIQYLSGADDALAFISAAGSNMNLGATAVFLLLNLVGFFTFALLGWLVLKRIGTNYQRKKLSDQSITLDSMWLMFGVVQSITFVFEGAAWILIGPLAFLCYKLISTICLATISRSTTKKQNPSQLLLLRVFSLGRISELWFYRFSKLWRHAGCVNMIAGPSLVTSSLEPHEFLAFLGGDLTRQFVKNDQDLESRINKLDVQPDFDQRYRVNEFFCHEDTWRPTLQRLATESESILMDLRSFSKANKGCIYELQVLIDSVDLRRVVFMVDDSTDTLFLEQSLRSLYQTINPASPNIVQKPACARLFHSNNPNRKSIKKLMLLLLASTRAC